MQMRVSNSVMTREEEIAGVGMVIEKLLKDHNLSLHQISYGPCFLHDKNAELGQKFFIDGNNAYELNFTKV